MRFKPFNKPLVLARQHALADGAAHAAEAQACLDRGNDVAGAQAALKASRLAFQWVAVDDERGVLNGTRSYDKQVGAAKLEALHVLERQVSIADTVRSGDLVVQEACEHVLLSFMRKPSPQALEMASVSVLGKGEYKLLLC